METYTRLNETLEKRIQELDAMKEKREEERKTALKMQDLVPKAKLYGAAVQALKNAQNALSRAEEETKRLQLLPKRQGRQGMRRRKRQMLSGNPILTDRHSFWRKDSKTACHAPSAVPSIIRPRPAAETM